jgi:hypothetical protein
MLAVNVVVFIDRRVREPDFLSQQEFPAFFMTSGNDGQYFGRNLPALSSQDFCQDRPVVTPSDFSPKGLCHKIYNLTVGPLDPVTYIFPLFFASHKSK